MDHVPDPTDFPAETDAPGLRRLDSAFSCQICGEVFDAPMMLSCGHTFCSMCVRRSLRDRHECPSCRNPAEEVHLLKNAQLEDLCDSWRSARATVLRLIEKADGLAKAALYDINGRPRKKRKLSGPTTPRARQTSGPSTERSSVEVVEDSETEGEMPKRDYVPSSDVEENEAQMQMERFVACPVCGKSIITKNVNEHIDSGCKSFLANSKAKQKETKNAWNNILGNTSPHSRSRGRGKKQRTSREATGDRLPKPSYSVLKDKKLREMLAEQDLPTTGTREQLIARHTQFVLLFNANLDRAEHLRRPISDLRREVKKWEDVQDVKKPSVDDNRAYLKKRSAEFKRHVEVAKAGLRDKAQGSNLRWSPATVEQPSRKRSTSNDVVNGDNGEILRPDSRQNALVDKSVVSDSESEDVS